jgi:hypothetical protein
MTSIGRFGPASSADSSGGNSRNRSSMQQASIQSANAWYSAFRIDS